MKKVISILLIAFFIAVSCSKSSDGGGGSNGGTNCSGVASAFNANVKPIIQSSCATDNTCHGAGSGNGPGELLTYNQVFNARAAIKTAVANGTMPKNSSLNTTQKNTIICWVDNGAPNN